MILAAASDKFAELFTKNDHKIISKVLLKLIFTVLVHLAKTHSNLSDEHWRYCVSNSYEIHLFKPGTISQLNEVCCLEFLKSQEWTHT